MNTATIPSNNREQLNDPVAVPESHNLSSAPTQVSERCRRPSVNYKSINMDCYGRESLSWCLEENEYSNILVRSMRINTVRTDLVFILSVKCFCFIVKLQLGYVKCYRDTKVDY